jgi:outer membrane protein TolC
MNKTLIIGLALALHRSLAQGQDQPAPAEAWQRVFFNSPATALPLLTAAAIKHSGDLRALELDKSLGRENLQLARKAILNSVGVGAGYTYGNQASIGLVNPQDPNQFGTFSAGRYSVGVNFALPLGQVVSRGHLIRREELTIERSEAVRQERENLLRQQLIPLYQNVLLARKVLTLQQEAHVNALTSQKLAEKQFRQGQLSLQEFSAAGSQLTAVSVAQETARTQYDTAFLLLEEVVGAKISTLMTTSAP